MALRLPLTAVKLVFNILSENALFSIHLDLRLPSEHPVCACMQQEVYVGK